MKLFRLRSRFSVLSVLAVVALLGCAGEGYDSETDVMVLGLDGKPLGAVRFPTSCNDAADEHLQRGLALLHHMTYIQAESEFTAAAEADPECAIAYWGQAMTYLHPLWPDVVSVEHHAAAQQLLDRAESAGTRNERDDAYIAALRSYYDGSSDERERLARYVEGWAAVHLQRPGDPEAKLFHALALTATAADKMHEKRKEAGAMAEEVLAEIPQHPGAHHYIIHAYDVPPLAEKALPIARTYGELAPEISHALHMTSHIFTRCGLWRESVEYNIRAAAAAGERVGAEVSRHHMHALDYLAYAYLQMADDVAAQQVLAAMRALEPPYQNHAATSSTFAAVPARLALERRDWEAATAVASGWPEAVPWEEYPHFVAIPVFTRALGAARTGDHANARKAIDELEKLYERAAALDMAYNWGTQVAIKKTAAEAWLAYESGEKDRGLELMQQAAEMEAGTEKNSVTPGAVQPAEELYADMLLDAGRHDEAQKQYETVLVRSPNRFNSLYGAGRAAELAGDARVAASYYRKLLETSPEPTGERAQLAHAREVLQ